VIDGGSGNDTIRGEEDDDELKGNDGDDTLYGGSGADTMYGQKGNDILYGEADDDLMFGGDGNDQIFGGAGDDKIFGKAGQDYMQGGIGADTFVFDDLSHSTLTELDTIGDFVQGVDVIDLKVFSFNSVNDFTIQQSAGETIIEDNNSDFAIKLNGSYNLTDTDFLFS
jgi:Ca2+-binding RTX toxin-like protein